MTDNATENGKPYRGKCLCGAIQYEADNFGPQMGHCHCSMCRKFHGAAFATLGEVKATEFRWISGEDSLQSFQADNGTIRQFCKHCGSSMTFEASGASGEWVEIALGTLDSEIPNKPDIHIYVGSKSNWMEVKDDLPQYQCGRNSEEV